MDHRSALAPLLASGLAAAALACVHPTPAQEAMSLARMHHEEAAVARLREEVAAHPDDLDAWALLVRLLAFEGDMPAAQVAATELAGHAPPGDPRAWIELGHAREVAHDFEGALAAYDTAASAAPASPAGPREGGMRAARWGEIEEAAPRLEEAIRRGATDAATWHALGLVRVHLKDLAGADEAYRRGLAADPWSAECWLGLATVAAIQGDAVAALRAYDAIASLRPAFAAAELGRAWALARLGREDEARAALARAAEKGAPAAAVTRQREALARGKGGADAGGASPPEDRQGD
jgi:cytochrome c-type biogenesis protein CcmH/NrfG